MPGLVVTLRPREPLVRGIVGAPDVALRPGGGGRVVMNSWALDASLASEDRAALVERLRLRAAALFPALRSAAVDSAAVGVRPIPLDGQPLVGWAPPVENLYVVVSHSGVHLAPLLGRLAAEEIHTGREAPALGAFRPLRASGGEDGPLDESTRFMTHTMRSATDPRGPGGT